MVCKSKLLQIVALLALFIIVAAPSGGGGGGGTFGGVVTGPSGCNSFNSTNPAGNTMNNALIIDNGAAFGPGGVGLTVNLQGASSIITEWDREWYTVATLPACPQADTTVVDATDTNCTAGGIPIAGDESLASTCTVHCTAGVWKFDGTIPDGPWAWATYPDGGPLGSRTDFFQFNDGTLLSLYSQNSSQPNVVFFHWGRLLLNGQIDGALELVTPDHAGTAVLTIPAETGTLAVVADNPVYNKLSAAPVAAPGAGKCVTFAVAGTNAGSCKLQAQCGTSTTPVTIVDNVGSGC